MRTSVFLWVLISLSGCGPQEDMVQLKTVVLVPHVSLPNLYSGHPSLNGGAGSLMVLNIWAPWCPPCLKEMPALQRLSDDMDSEHFRVVGVTTDDRFLAIEFLERQGITFDNFFDVDKGVIGGVLGVNSFPQTLIIDQQGILLERMEGFRDWDDPEIRSSLNSLIVK